MHSENCANRCSCVRIQQAMRKAHLSAEQFLALAEARNGGPLETPVAEKFVQVVRYRPPEVLVIVAETILGG